MHRRRALTLTYVLLIYLNDHFNAIQHGFAEKHGSGRPLTYTIHIYLANFTRGMESILFFGTKNSFFQLAYRKILNESIICPQNDLLLFLSAI